jgi:hypothetical protein
MTDRLGHSVKLCAIRNFYRSFRFYFTPLDDSPRSGCIVRTLSLSSYARSDHGALYAQEGQSDGRPAKFPVRSCGVVA